MRTHLVIPDSHAKPGVSNRRFELLGKLIVDRRPDVIVNIGDMADMESLCTYDKGTKSFEGRRYESDLEAMYIAQNYMLRPLWELQASQAKSKKAKYLPELHYCIGNHEARIDRVTEKQPELSGFMNIKDLALESYGWNVVPFLDTLEVDGIHYAHYFTGGVMSKPIGGDNAASTLLRKQHVSCTMGHTHTLDYKVQTTATGQRIHGLICGSFLEPDQIESYAGPANKLWWRGVIMKHIRGYGDYDLELISIERLEKEYGRRTDGVV